MTQDPSTLMDFIDQVERLAKLPEDVALPTSIDRIWEVFLEQLHFLIDVQQCALFRVDDDTREFRLADVAPESAGPLLTRELEMQIDIGTFAWVLKRGQAALIPAQAVTGGVSVVMLPLATSRRTLGAILVTTPLNENTLTGEASRLVNILGRQTALMMENSLLYQRLEKKHRSLELANEEIRRLSITDPLTGCFNRGYLSERLPQELSRARRYRHSLAVILADIDHFKTINDGYGHLAGDRVLKAFAQRVQGLIRSGVDWLVRYGGEEFLLVLPETSAGNGKILAERLRLAVGERPFDTGLQPISVTASFGVTGVSPEDDGERFAPDALIDEADRFLYRAKTEGRNRVVDMLPGLD
jgi:diguanylate cyclase (GGDEF)-like protein